MLPRLTAAELQKIAELPEPAAIIESVLPQMPAEVGGWRLTYARTAPADGYLTYTKDFSAPITKEVLDGKIFVRIDYDSKHEVCWYAHGSFDETIRYSWMCQSNQHATPTEAIKETAVLVDRIFEERVARKFSVENAKKMGDEFVAKAVAKNPDGTTNESLEVPHKLASVATEIAQRFARCAKNSLLGIEQVANKGVDFVSFEMEYGKSFGKAKGRGWFGD